MARRSLQASPDGIKKAKLAFLRTGWTQQQLASEVGLETRQPIWKFFSGKPIERYIFSEICFRLNLELEEIALSPEGFPTINDKNILNSISNIDALVTQIRSERYEIIQDQCGTLRLLDIARPVCLDELYVEVNILEEITSYRWLDISDLQGFQPEEFDRLGLGKIRQERIPGLKAIELYTKLMVLGKPGAGKTTFLQYLAIQCNQGNLISDRIPIFIRLKNFAEDALDEAHFSLLNYITQEFERCGICQQKVETLLNQGRVILLLDGLDEVPEAASDEVIKQIRKLSENYYKNSLIITCRLAAQEYRFQGFTEVEIADFNSEQIEKFVKKWFVTVARNSPESGLKKASFFLEQMALPENQPIQELAATPVLLNLTCLVFHALANFPTKRSDLYKQGLDLLLIRWDESRGIKRDEIYRDLSLHHKLQLLSQLAIITFEQGEYFFEENTINQLISNYLQAIKDTPLDSSTIELNSAAVLKSIEAQHGLLVERARRIYSFSHLTFQEYFTARAIVSASESSLPQLVMHLPEKRWREVFLLTAQILPDANSLLQLMQQQIDKLVFAEFHNMTETATPADAFLQQFLLWIIQKALDVKTSYKPAAVRAFYLTLALPPHHRLTGNQALALAIDPTLASEVRGELALDLALAHALAVAVALTSELIHDRLKTLYLALDLGYLTDAELMTDSLQQLKKQLPPLGEDREYLKQWWHVNGQAWASQLRALLIQHRNIGQEWHLSEPTLQLLEQYSTGHKLLVDCLNSNCQITPTLRQKIEDKLLLPLWVE